jgi:hypothetical protein
LKLGILARDLAIDQHRYLARSRTSRPLYFIAEDLVSADH